MKKFIAFSLIALTACNSKNSESNQTTAKQSLVEDSIAAVVSVFDTIQVDNKKDPSCGMPVKGNISDTTLYEGKLYGFCSAECKQDFLKNPKAHIAAAELK